MILLTFGCSSLYRLLSLFLFRRFLIMELLGYMISFFNFVSNYQKTFQSYCTILFFHLDYEVSVLQHLHRHFTLSDFLIPVNVKCCLMLVVLWLSLITNEVDYFSVFLGHLCLLHRDVFSSLFINFNRIDFSYY